MAHTALLLVILITVEGRGSYLKLRVRYGLLWLSQALSLAQSIWWEHRLWTLSAAVCG